MRTHDDEVRVFAGIGGNRFSCIARALNGLGVEPRIAKRGEHRRHGIFPSQLVLFFKELQRRRGRHTVDFRERHLGVVGRHKDHVNSGIRTKKTGVVGNKGCGRFTVIRAVDGE